MENPHDSVLDNVKFRKAIDQSGKIVDITDVKNQSISKQQEFRCIGCERRLRPRTGEIRTAHFYHHKSQACSFETYLHKLGKQLFYQEFQKRKDESNEFILGIPEKVVCKKFESFGKTCTTRTMDSGKVNLIAEYPEIKMETRSGQFIPDLLIYHPELNKFVFIEIVVSNAPSIEKINSGLPIIEINAKSEEDFNFMKQGFISESIAQVKIHNFQEGQISIGECDSICQIDYTDKAYFETLMWIRDSFIYNREQSIPFVIEFKREYSCSRYFEKFQTHCNYSEWKRSNILPYYEAAKIDLKNGTAFLVISHISDKTKDILIIGGKRSRPVGWLGGVISINEVEIGRQRRTKYLNRISEDSGLFRLETNRRGVVSKDCGRDCKQMHQFFCIRKDMGAVMPELILTDFRLHNDSFPYVRLLDPSMISENKEEMFYKMVEECLKEGIAVRNCYVCRYHALNNRDIEEGDGPIFCRAFRMACNSNEAIDCTYYKPDLKSTSLNYQGRQRRFTDNNYWRNPGWKWRDSF
jgi:hypothetical protein